MWKTRLAKMRSFAFTFVFLGSAIFWGVSAGSVQASLEIKKERLQKYIFIRDFSQKEETPDLNVNEVFWRYPIAFPKPTFQFTVKKLSFEKQSGTGRVYEHLNLARRHFQEDNLEKGVETLLSAKHRYGESYPEHRLTDLMIAYGFLKLHEETKISSYLKNATVFLDYALRVKSPIKDPYVDQEHFARFSYILSAIHFNQKHYSKAFQIANFSVRKIKASQEDFAEHETFLPKIYLIQAEALIQTKEYNKLLDVYDRALREALDAETIQHIFSRMGDVYYGLNNFALAAEMYKNALTLEKDQDLFARERVLLGESLFWQGKFEDAHRLFSRTLEYEYTAAKPLSYAVARLAQLRKADSYLAMGEIEKAKLEYFRAQQNLKSEKDARVRLACLSLPRYDGKNAQHARNLLTEAYEKSDLDSQARELALACLTLAHDEGEIKDAIEKFYAAYPNSRYLKKMLPVVKEMRREEIIRLLKSENWQQGLLYYEEFKEKLFKKPSADIDRYVFLAYLKTKQTKKAHAYLPRFKPTNHSEIFYQTVIQMLEGQNFEYPETDNFKIDPNDTLSMEYFALLSLDSKYDKHTPFLLEIALNSFDEISDFCKKTYPLLQRTRSKNFAFEKKINKVFDQYFPEIIQKDAGCALSLLELEFEYYKDRPQKVAQLYSARKDWPKPGAIGMHFIQISEWLLSMKDDKALVLSGKNILDNITTNSRYETKLRNLAQSLITEYQGVYSNLW